MPCTLQVSDTELLMSETDVLFRLSLELTKRRHELEQMVKGNPLTTGDFRGTVTAITHNAIVCKRDDGVQKTLPISRQRVRQLLAVQTTRK